MREVVFAGAPEWVAEQRRDWMIRVEEFAKSLGLPAKTELATDPFFGGAARGKRLLQQLKELKYELRVGSMAIASFNLHETHFTERFDIAMKGGGVAHTGCVAFGLERLALISAAMSRSRICCTRSNESMISWIFSMRPSRSV